MLNVENLTFTPKPLLGVIRNENDVMRKFYFSVRKFKKTYSNCLNVVKSISFGNISSCQVLSEIYAQFCVI